MLKFPSTTRSRLLCTLSVVILIGGAGVLLIGCGATEIRVHNASTRDFQAVTISGQSYGKIPAGATTAYKPVDLTLRYGLLKMTVDGTPINAQTLNFGSSRFTYRVKIKNLEAGHLDIDVVAD